MSAPFWVERLGTECVRGVDAPTAPVGLDDPGRRLPLFDTGDALRKRTEDGRGVVRLAVGGGLAEPVLVTPEVPVQARPGLDLGAVSCNPRFAASLRGEEGLHVVIGSGPGLFGTRRDEWSEIGVGQQASHIGRSVIGDPLAEGGVLPEGSIEVLLRHGRPGRRQVPGHGLLPVLGQCVDQGPEGVALGEVVGVMADLPSRVIRGGDIQVVRQPAPGELGVAGLLVEAVATETEGVIHGDPLGAEDREGISQAGGGFGVAAGEYCLAPVIELDHERPRRLGTGLVLDAGSYVSSNVTLGSGNVTLPGESVVRWRHVSRRNDRHHGAERAVAEPE